VFNLPTHAHTSEGSLYQVRGRHETRWDYRLLPAEGAGISSVSHQDGEENRYPHAADLSTSHIPLG